MSTFTAVSLKTFTWAEFSISDPEMVTKIDFGIPINSMFR